jgi:raffinose/stachyose/melibiose transport system substrate-binding protein
MTESKKKGSKGSSPNFEADESASILGKKISRRTAISAGATAGIAGVVGLAVGGAAGYLAGNSGKSATTSTSSGQVPAFWGEPQSITVQTLSNTNTASILAYCTKVYEASHPGVTINPDLIAEADMNADVISALPSAPPPDVFYNSTLPAFNAQAVATGDALVLDPWVTAYGWDTETNAWNTYLVNGHSYWFYYSYIYFGNLYYNADLFTKLGITVPADIQTNPTELYAIGNQLTKAGVLPLVHGYATQPEWFLNTFSDWTMNQLTVPQFQQLSTSYGTDLYTSNFAGRPITLTDSTMAPMWQMVADWRDNMFTQDITTLTDSTAVSLFASEKAGMYMVGSWGVGDLAPPTTTFNYDFFPLTSPVPNGGGNKRMVLFGSTYFVTSKTKSPNLVADFLNTFLTPNAQAESLNTQGLYPGIALGTSVITNPSIAQSVAQASTLDYQFSLAGSVATQMHNPFEAALASILSSQATPTQAATTLENFAIQQNQTGAQSSTASGSSS